MSTSGNTYVYVVGLCRIVVVMDLKAHLGGAKLKLDCNRQMSGTLDSSSHMTRFGKVSCNTPFRSVSDQATRSELAMSRDLYQCWCSVEDKSVQLGPKLCCKQLKHR